VGRVPLLHRYYETLRIPTFLPPRFVAFAWRYHSVRLSSSLLFGPTPAEGPGGLALAPTTPDDKNGNVRGFPGSWRILMCSCRVLRPRQDRCIRPYDAPTRPRSQNDEGSQRELISGLNRTASALAVYASSRPVSRPRRKTRFRVLTQLSQAGLITRRIPTKGFDAASYIISSSPRLRLAQSMCPRSISRSRASHSPVSSGLFSPRSRIRAIK
jgi:hypothetical protein